MISHLTHLFPDNPDDPPEVLEEMAATALKHNLKQANGLTVTQNIANFFDCVDLARGKPAQRKDKIHACKEGMHEVLNLLGILGEEDARTLLLAIRREASAISKTDENQTT